MFGVQKYQLYFFPFRFYLNEEFNDIVFTFDLLDDIIVGETFFVLLQIKNRSTQYSYRVSGLLAVDSIQYTGRNRDRIKAIDFDQNIPPESVDVIEMEVTFYDYFKKLTDQGAFNISCIAKVHDTGYDYFAEDDFRVRKPDVRIKLQGTPEVDQEIDVILRLANPLPMPLKNCVFHVQGTGIQRQLQLKVSEKKKIAYKLSNIETICCVGSRSSSRRDCIRYIQIYTTVCRPSHICREIFLKTIERCRWFHCIRSGAKTK